MDQAMEVLTGDVALARAAVAAGVRFVTGYPGSPSTGTFDAILAMSAASEMTVSWAINECIAFEMAFGASIGGRRALLCVKSVGLNVALDPLLTMVLTGCNAGLVILLGDDPGGWASQNEQDSRILALLADVPLIEPSDPQEAAEMLVAAFDLSESLGTPVIVRETRALALASGPVRHIDAASRPAPVYRREPGRWISLPENVVRNHRKVHEKLEAVRALFEESALNRMEGRGRVGVVACGTAYAKLRETVGAELLAHFRVLKLSTFHPLPESFLAGYLAQVKSILVFEENEPYVEERLAAVAQVTGHPLTVVGRKTGHLPYGGELDGAQIVAALRKYAPSSTGQLSAPPEEARNMPSQKPLCIDCPYIPLFDTLVDRIQMLGGRDRAIVVGEPGCMVRAQLPPMELMDVKYSLGSSLGLAVGLAVSCAGRKVISLTGDSSFLHHGWGGLVEAVRNRVNLLVILLDNGTTALSGQQPHAGTPYDVRGQDARAVDLLAMTTVCGPDRVRLIDPFDRNATREAIEMGLTVDGVKVIVARKPCPRLVQS